MDIEKIVISDLERKTLKLIRKHNDLNIFQLHGYFKFPDFETLLISIQNLEDKGLICRKQVGNQSSFQITKNGDSYFTWILTVRRINSKKFVNSVALTLIGAIIGFLVNKYLG